MHKPLIFALSTLLFTGCATTRYMDLESAIIQAAATAKQAAKNGNLDATEANISVSVAVGVNASAEVPVPVVPIGIAASSSRTTTISFDINLANAKTKAELLTHFKTNKPTVYTLNPRTGRLTPIE